KVATPTMMRALTCHHEVGRRSSRATISSTEERVAVASIVSSPCAGCAASAAPQCEQSRRVVAANGVSHPVVEHDAVDEMPGLLGRLEGIVGGEQHVIVAERVGGAVERLGRATAARRPHNGGRDAL